MKELYKNKYRVKSARLQNHDYQSDGFYFITICTLNREHFFGNIPDNIMEFSPIGEIAFQYWRDIPNHNPNAIIDEFIIMPNHIHGIIQIKIPPVQTQHLASPDVQAQHLASPKTQTQHFAPTDTQTPAPPISQTQNANHTIETQNVASLRYGPQSNNIPSIVRGYKAGVKKYATMNKINFAWQPRYYDRVIRNENELNRIRKYIINNPRKWNSYRKNR